MGVSRGGALRIDLGIDATGCECSTSFCWFVSVSSCAHETSHFPTSDSRRAHPASIRIQEPPPHPIRPNLLHAAAAVEKHGQHPLAQVDDLLVLFRVGGIGGVVGHGVLLGNRRDNESRMKPCESIPERCEFGIPPPNIKVLQMKMLASAELSCRGIEAGDMRDVLRSGWCRLYIYRRSRGSSQRR